MKENDKFFKTTLKSLLNERLSQAEAQSLKDEGFQLKHPTRKTAVMIALYKKAAGGDLSAIKELRGIVGENREDAPAGGTVVIVDDIGKQAVTNRGTGV